MIVVSSIDRVDRRCWLVAIAIGRSVHPATEMESPSAKRTLTRPNVPTRFAVRGRGHRVRMADGLINEDHGSAAGFVEQEVRTTRRLR